MRKKHEVMRAPIWPVAAVYRIADILNLEHVRWYGRAARCVVSASPASASALVGEQHAVEPRALVGCCVEVDAPIWCEINPLRVYAQHAR